MISDNVSDPNSKMCSTFIDNLLALVGDYNPYALDFATCSSNDLDVQRRRLLSKTLPSHRRKTNLQQLDPCEESYLAKYLNEPSVKSSLHVNQNLTWSVCSESLQYLWDDYSTAPIYSDFLSSDLQIHILVYSGNDDAVCSTLGSQKWIFNLNLHYTTSSYWKIYHYDSQIAGYLTQFNDDRFKFLVIRGAGHEVPTYKPAVSLDMIQRFLSWNWNL